MERSICPFKRSKPQKVLDFYIFNFNLWTCVMAVYFSSVYVFNVEYKESACIRFELIQRWALNLFYESWSSCYTIVHKILEVAWPWMNYARSIYCTVSRQRQAKSIKWVKKYLKNLFIDFCVKESFSGSTQTKEPSSQSQDQSTERNAG